MSRQGGEHWRRPLVCPEKLKLFTDLTFSAIILILGERTSAPIDTLW
jgi:hypothetical protein